MIVRATDCGACREQRIEISMTRNEAEMLETELRTTWSSGPMFMRLKARLAAVVAPPEKKKPSNGAARKSA